VSPAHGWPAGPSATAAACFCQIPLALFFVQVSVTPPTPARVLPTSFVVHFEPTLTEDAARADGTAKPAAATLTVISTRIRRDLSMSDILFGVLQTGNDLPGPTPPRTCDRKHGPDAANDEGCEIGLTSSGHIIDSSPTNMVSR
jgi:hypothetical protein